MVVSISRFGMTALGKVDFHSGFVASIDTGMLINKTVEASVTPGGDVSCRML